MLQTFNKSLNNLTEKLSIWLDTLITGLPNAILALLVMVAAFWASGWVKKNVKKLMSRFSTDRSVNNLVASVASIVIVLMALFISLGIMNLDQALTSLLTTAGIAGLAIGMALQDPIMNTFSGVMMSMRKFYNIGDWIQTNGYEGQIQKINLRWTELQKPSGEKIFLPNKTIVTEPLENYSIAGRRRVELACGVAYNSDLDQVMKVAKRAVADRFDYIKKADEVEFFYTEFAGSSINFVIRFWMETTSLIEYKTAKSLAIIAIKQAFDSHEIGIPFPIRTLDFSMMDALPETESMNETEKRDYDIFEKEPDEPKFRQLKRPGTVKRMVFNRESAITEERDN